MKESIKYYLTDGIGRLVDFFFLNLVFLITCIPIITIGASCNAMYYVMFHVIDEEDSHLIKKYFKAWKDSFIKCTPIWILALILFFIGYQCLYILGYMELGAAAILLYSVQMIAFYLICTMLIYYFSLHARFDNTIRKTLWNAFYLALRNLPINVPCFCILMAPIILIFVMPSISYLILGFMIIIGFALQFYFQSKILFKLYLTF